MSAPTTHAAIPAEQHATSQRCDAHEMEQLISVPAKGLGVIVLSERPSAHPGAEQQGMRVAAPTCTEEAAAAAFLAGPNGSDVARLCRSDGSDSLKPCAATFRVSAQGAPLGDGGRLQILLHALID